MEGESRVSYLNEPKLSRLDCGCRGDGAWVALRVVQIA